MAKKQVNLEGTLFDVSYELINPEQEKTILFLHGWGSSKAVMKSAFGKLLPGCRHLYVDLPGFGKSPTSEVMTTRRYAAVMERFLTLMNITPDIAVGHSFGGKVAALLRCDSATPPEKLVLLSSAGIPKKKSFKVRAKIRLFKLLKPFGGAGLPRRSSSGALQTRPPPSPAEKRSTVSSPKAVLPRWRAITSFFSVTPPPLPGR